MQGLLVGRRQLRRWWVESKLRLQARLKGAHLELDLAPDVQFGARVRISIDAGTTNQFCMRAGSALYDDVLVLLRGGSIVLGPRATVRKGSVLNVSGSLELRGDNILSYYNVVHCADRIVLERQATASEFVTIVDSRHYHTDDQTYFVENVESAPVTIGRNTWLANGSSVLMGVTLGDHCVVAGHSVVRDDVPDRAVVGGAPAKVLRQR